MPTSTSGHTLTHSTSAPSTVVRNGSRLWPPSYRTSSPSRHAEMPRRIRGSRVAGGLIGGLIVVCAARLAWREQADPRGIAEHQNATQVVAEHRHRERQPELVAGDEDAERDRHD